MKKSLLAAAVLSAVSFGAYADGVELYGVVDLAIASVAHQTGANSAGQGNISVTGEKIATTTTAGVFTGMVNGGISPSRWGIKGSETIDGDLSAVFQLEQRFNATSGVVIDQLKAKADNFTTPNNVAGSSLNGQFFNAEAWVGLKDSNMGRITFGRQYVATQEIINLNDPVPAFQFSPINYSGSLGGGMGITELLRQDNSVKYANKIDNISYTLMYKFGNVSGSTQAGTSYSANLIYKTDKLKVGLGYMGANDALNLGTATSSTAVPATSYNTNGYVFSIGYNVMDPLELKAGYERWTLSNPSNPTLASSLVYPQGSDGITVTGSAYTGSNASQNLTWVGFNYAVSNHLKAMVGYYNNNVDAVTCTTAACTKFAPSGNISWASVLLDYTLSKRTDVYAGYMAENYGGSLFSGYNANYSGGTASAAVQNNSIVALGMRHKF